MCGGVQKKHGVSHLSDSLPRREGSTDAAGILDSESLAHLCPWLVCAGLSHSEFPGSPHTAKRSETTKIGSKNEE